MKRIGTVFALALLLWACGDFSVTMRQLLLTLDPPSVTVPVGEEVEFRYEAQGRSLAGLILDYGDGGLDSLGFQGAQTASGNCPNPSGTCNHAYEAPGTYVLTGILEDFTGQVVTAELTVEVIPPPGG